MRAGRGSITVLVLIGVGIVLLAGFVVWQNRAARLPAAGFGQVGGSLGTAVFSSVAAGVTVASIVGGPAATVAGYTAAFAGGAAVLAAGAIFSAFAVRPGGRAELAEPSEHVVHV